MVACPAHVNFNLTLWYYGQLTLLLRMGEKLSRPAIKSFHLSQRKVGNVAADICLIRRSVFALGSVDVMIMPNQGLKLYH